MSTRHPRIPFIGLVFLLLWCAPAWAQTTAFTYQGKLSDAGAPAAGTYELQFKVFDTATVGTGTQQPQLTLDFTVAGGNAVSVVNGAFTVSLDFGGAAFPGSNRFLEISVRHNSSEAFAPLAPRQPITANPYAIRSANAASAESLSNACIACVTNAQIQSVDGSKITGTVANATSATTAANATTATNANTATNATQLGGVAASQYVITTDSRLSDARPPTPGSASYIQNGASTQASSDFNISGNGTAGGTFSGNIVNAVSQYNIGGNRVLSNSGIDNLFVGFGAGAGVGNDGHQNSFVGKNAGAANTFGSSNSFFGGNAGFSNKSGSDNSFFGSSAGVSNKSGNDNSFFGSGAGSSNLGNQNSFFGRSAGNTNTTGSNNTIIGNSADVATNNLDHATAIGAEAIVSTNNTIALGRSGGQDAVQIPGNLTVTGTFNASGANITNVNAANISSGTLDNARLGVVPIANGGTGSNAQNFVDLTTVQTIAGNKTFSNTLSGSVINATTYFSLAGNSVLSTAGIANLFAGFGAGGITSGTGNSFFGFNAGLSNSSGGANSFFGAWAGFVSQGDENSFFGFRAGQKNDTGKANSFFGSHAGDVNTAGEANSFFGDTAGIANQTGSSNSFFGKLSGKHNTVGSNNTIIGYNADVTSNNLDNATAIGANASVAQNNSLVLGSINGVNGASASTNVGIGTTTPSYPLTVNGSAGSGQTQGAAEFSNGAADTGVRLSNSTAGGRTYTLFSSGTGSGIGVGSFNIFDATANATRISVNSSGNIGIGTTNPSSFKLQVAGAVGPNTDNASGLGDATHRWTAVFAANGTIQTSDGRLKQRLQNLHYGLNTVLQLRPVSFEWKDRSDTRTHLGLIAQEVEKVIPEVIQRSSDPSVPLGMSYTDLVPVLIKAIQEQQTEFARRDAELKSLKADNAALKEANAQLNARIAAIEQAMQRPKGQQ